MGCLLGLTSNRVVRTINVPSTGQLAIYISSRINYPVTYSFYTANGNNFLHGLRARRVISRILAIRRSFNRQIDRVIFVNVNRPLLGIRSIITTVHYLGRSINVDRQSVALSAINVPKHVHGLTSRRLRIALTVDLRTSGRNRQLRLVPDTGTCPLRTLLRRYHSCIGVAKQHIAFRCVLLTRLGSRPRGTVRLTRRLHNFRDRIGLVPCGPVSRTSCRHPDSHHVHRFIGRLRTHRVTIDIHCSQKLRRGTTYNRLQTSGITTAISNSVVRPTRLT